MAPSRSKSTVYHLSGDKIGTSIAHSHYRRSAQHRPICMVRDREPLQRGGGKEPVRGRRPGIDRRQRFAICSKCQCRGHEPSICWADNRGKTREALLERDLEPPRPLSNPVTRGRHQEKRRGKRYLSEARNHRDHDLTLSPGTDTRSTSRHPNQYPYRDH
jgi:hypothetical protein